ncbi:MAG: peroxiredoxin family protein [Sporichthyaceae bacterium]
MPRLENHQLFPTLAVPRVGGGSIRLPDDLAGDFGVVLVYRGAWCPYCRAQLGAFSRAAERLAESRIGIVAMSVDDEATTAALVDKLHLAFPVAHSVDATEAAAALGSYVHDEPRYLESTGFVVTPAGTVLTAVYSSNAIGRLLPDDVVGQVTYVQQMAQSPGRAR